jgi:polyphosphate kinase
MLHPTPLQAEPQAVRARALAESLHTYLADPATPEGLREAAFLLQESQNLTRPPVERLRILGLAIAGVDRFSIETFMVSHNQESALHPEGAILFQAQRLMQEAGHLLRAQLLPTLLAEHGVELRAIPDLTPGQYTWLHQFYNDRVYPLLTPLAVDPGHPFPFISSFSLNVLVLLADEEATSRWSQSCFARVKIPRLLPRFIPIPVKESDAAPRALVRSEELVRHFLGDLFPGMTVVSTHLFRLLRVAEENLHFDSVLFTRGARRNQLNLPVVRVDIETAMPDNLVRWLAEHLRLPVTACFRLEELVGQLHLVELANLFEERIEGG